MVEPPLPTWGSRIARLSVPLLVLSALGLALEAVERRTIAGDVIRQRFKSTETIEPDEGEDSNGSLGDDGTGAASC